MTDDKEPKRTISGSMRLGESVYETANGVQPPPPPETPPITPRSDPPKKSSLRAAAEGLNRLAAANEELVEETRGERRSRQRWQLALMAVLGVGTLMNVGAAGYVGHEINVLVASNQAAIDAQVKRQAASAAKAEADDSFDLGKEKKAAVIEEKALDAELKAVKLGPRPDPVVVKELEQAKKKAAKKAQEPPDSSDLH